MTALPTRYELWYGRDESPSERRPLHAGPIELELEGADLRYARAGSTEILRRLYVAVRDHSWNTIPAELSGLEVEDASDRFAIRFEARNRADEIDFRWRGAIEGEPDGTVTAELHGIAEADFRYNRIGFCILHPLNCAGRPYRSRAPVGPSEGELPLLVGPQEIRDGKVYPLFPAFEELEIDIEGDTSVRFNLEGDLFEMEDQRNWTDGSFKTYSTPLALGFPHDARKGQVIHQRVVMSPLRLPAGAGPADSSDARARLALGERLAGNLPPIGLGAASHGDPLGERETVLLRALRPDHLRADLHLGEPGFRPELARVAGDASALGAALELAVFVTDDAEHELHELASLLPTAAAVARVLVFHESEKATDARWVRLVRDRLGPVLGAVPFAGGTNAYFAELNRDRPDADAVDAIAYSISPQAHAFDEASIVETAQAQADTVRSARAFPAGKPIVVGPVTLLPRFNPNATEPEAVPAPGDLPAQVDPRQMSLFAAAWTLASAKYLAESGTAAVTYYETTGWRGVVETERGPPLPERFPSRPGMVFPVYHVLADLAERKEAALVAFESSAPLSVDGIALDQDGSVRLLVAGLVPAAQRVVLEGLPDGLASARRLSETTAESALLDPQAFRSSDEEMLPVRGGRLELDLRPFEVVRIDLLPARKG
jgi:hypothetical protein